MLGRPSGHVSLLVHFLPREVREVAQALAALLGDVAGVVMSLDAGRGTLELIQVRDVDLRLLTEWLYRRGARGVFVRYQHEGWPGSIGAGAVAESAPLN